MRPMTYKFNDGLDTVCYLNDVIHVSRSEENKCALVIRTRYADTDTILWYRTPDEAVEEYNTLVELMDEPPFLYFRGLNPHIIIVSDVVSIMLNEDTQKVRLNSDIHNATSISVTLRNRESDATIFYTDNFEMMRDFKDASLVLKQHERGKSNGQ